MAGGFVIRGVKFEFTQEQQRLLAAINDPDIHEVINRYIGNALNQFVPYKSGNLRKSMHATKSRIIWGNQKVPYAHYQYAGIVYAPNKPVWYKGSVVGWKSIGGMTKYPTDRFLGTPGVFYEMKDGEKTGRELWRFGYTTANTESEWVDLDLIPPREYEEISKSVTRILKRKLGR